MKLHPFLYTNKFTWKWSIDLNLRAKAIKFLGQDTEVNLYGIGLGMDFYIWHLKHKKTKEKTDELDSVKI